MNQRFHYGSSLTERARELRKNMTPEEKTLWYQFLAKHPVKFYRQRPIDDLYIVDFFSLQARLAIEVDGGQHYEDKGLQKDEARDKYLTGIGLRVIRIPNNAIHQHFPEVCDYINHIIEEQMSSTPQSRPAAVPAPPRGS